MFVCDTTGSMGDELSYLQAELMDIIQRVKKQNGNIPLRLSVNFYRDEGEEYVVRSFPFTEDFDRAVQNLGQQTAEGAETMRRQSKKRCLTRFMGMSGLMPQALSCYFWSWMRRRMQLLRIKYSSSFWMRRKGASV